MQAFITLFQLLLFIGAGLVLGKYFLRKYLPIIPKCISLVIYTLLFLVAFETSQHFSTIAWERIFIHGFILSFIITLANILCAWIVFKPRFKSTKNNSNNVQKSRSELQLKHIFKNISFTLIAFIFGIFAFWLTDSMGYALTFKSWNILLLLMLFIGMELSAVRIPFHQFKLDLLTIPFVIFLSSSIISLAFPFIFNNLDWRQSLALVQGYGWYSMTATLQQQLNTHYFSTLALIIDLSREIIAILFIQIFGRSFPKTAIGLGGATSMDATLGMIQQSCGKEYFFHALVSGLVLSLLGPILLVWLLS